MDSVNIFLSHKVYTNNLLANLGSACLWVTNERKVMLPYGKSYYSVLEEKEPLWWSYVKKICDGEAVLQSFTWLALGICTGSLGTLLKGVSWINSGERRKNLEYIYLVLQDQKNVEFPVLQNDVFNQFSDPYEEQPWNLPKDLLTEIASYLEVSDLKTVLLVCKNWHLKSIFDEMVKKSNQKITGFQGEPLNQLSNIPKIRLPSKTKPIITDPIRCFSEEDLQSLPIVHGIKNGIPFIAINYKFHQINEVKSGILVFWKKNEENWSDACHSKDVAQIGIHLTSAKDPVEQEANILSCLSSLFEKKRYKTDTIDIFID